jgi:hypothetical protein
MADTSEIEEAEGNGDRKKEAGAGPSQAKSKKDGPGERTKPKRLAKPNPRVYGPD